MELDGKRIAILTEDNYHEIEFWYPLLRMMEAGAQVQVVGASGVDEYYSQNGFPVKVDATAEQVTPGDFDAVIVPGGYAPDRMTAYKPIVNLVRGVYERGGVVGMVCHAAWVSLGSGNGNGDAYSSALKDDAVNAQIKWLDRREPQNGRLISCAGADDLPVFCRTLIAAVQKHHVEAPMLAMAPEVA